jgi:transposase InsO family protein
MPHVTPEIRKLIVRARRNGKKVKEIAEIFGVSRKTVWKWYKRSYHPGRACFKDRSRRPHTIRRKVDHDIENAIIVLRDSFNWGTHRIAINLASPPGYIRHLLETITGKKWNSIHLSRQSVNTVLKKHRRNGTPYKKSKKDWHYYRARKPNNLWQIDIKGPFLLDGKRMKALIVIDDHSRFIILCRLFVSIKAETVIESLKWATRRYGRPKRILCDNGSQFKNDLKTWCKRQRIKLEHAPPYYPEAKGKVERTIRNFKEEFLVLDKVFDNASELLPEYLDWHNTERYSIGISGSPASFYY